MAIKTTGSPDSIEMVQIISEKTSALTGRDFISELAKSISTIMGMRYCFVAVCANREKTRLRTIIFAEGKKQLENFEYNTNESGCQMMMNGEPYFLAKGAQTKFPAAKGIEAYVGAPVISPRTGEILGHIAVTDPHPVTEEKNNTAMLSIFAARIAAELERMQAEEELSQKVKENEFYFFTLNHLKEAVFWVTQEGKIWQVNQSAAEFTGYSREELLDKDVTDLNASIRKTGWNAAWEQLRKQKKVVYDAKLRRKDGTLTDVEITQNFLVFEGQEYTCSIVRNIQQRKMEEELLFTVSEATSGFVGHDFLRELTKFITSTMGVKYSFISECANEEKTRVRTISFVDNATPVENIEYDLEGTPCEIVMQGRDYFCPAGLDKIFPKEKGLQSYVAVPIISPSTGEILGHLAALDDHPMSEKKSRVSILKIFAARAGSEIERIKAEQKLKQTLMDANVQLQQKLKESEERYKDLFEEAPIAYVHEGLDTKFIKANQAEKAGDLLKKTGLDPAIIRGNDVTFIRQTITDRIQTCKYIAPAYMHVDGTSFAAPIVSSVIAQMLEVNPQLTPSQIREVLFSTAKRLENFPCERQGFGAIRPRKAILKILKRGPVMKPHTSPFVNQQNKTIEFYVQNDCASQISLAGSFNHWAQDVLLMQPGQDGIWKIEIPMLPGGRYQYKFFVDDKRWVEDYDNPLREPDGFRGFNSILVIEN